MLSSDPGARASGASSSLNSQNPNARHEAAHSHQLGAGTLGMRPDLPRSDGVTNGRGIGPSSQGHSSPLDSNNWFDYAAQALSNSSLPQHSGVGPSASSTMIGPTSTLYDPDTSLQQPDAGQAYQQWINHYNDQQYGRGMTHYTNFLQSYPSVTYSESIADTVTPPTADQYQQQIQQNTLYNSYRSELLNATGPVNPANPTSSSTPDARQAYQHPTPESTLNSYTGSPVSHVSPTSHQQVYQSPQQTQNSITPRDQPVSQRENQQQVLARFKGQPQQHAVAPQTQQAPHLSPHEHQPPLPSQPYHEGQSGFPSASQRPSPAQQFSQESGNNVRESNARKQPQESGSPYTTNQLNIRIYQPNNSQTPGSSPPTPASRPGQAYVSGRPSPRANTSGTGPGVSQATRSPPKPITMSGTSKRSPKHPNATSQAYLSSDVNSSSKRRKRDYEGNFITGEGDTEGESDGEEGDGFTGGIEIGLGGLGVESPDGKTEKGGPRPYVTSANAEAVILTN